MTNRRRYFVVDAFTPRPFAGNPAAVVLLDQWPDDKWLRNVAAEMNLSETAFLVPKDHRYDLRWFTPRVEVDLCGHATLASALVLARIGKLADEMSVEFSTRSGILRADKRGSRIELDFPLKAAATVQPPEGLLESLGVTSRSVGRNEFDYLVEVESETTLRGVAPDYKRLAGVNCRGVIITSLSDDPQFDFVSRFFAPAVGIDEDPVTGSAHCCLADFWSRRLNKAKLIGYQASPRGGIVYVEVRGERVQLGGEGVIVAEGELMVG